VFSNLSSVYEALKQFSRPEQTLPIKTLKGQKQLVAGSLFIATGEAVV
jgi:hypothetical protein